MAGMVLGPRARRVHRAKKPPGHNHGQSPGGFYGDFYSSIFLVETPSPSARGTLRNATQTMRWQFQPAGGRCAQFIHLRYPSEAFLAPEGCGGLKVFML